MWNDSVRSQMLINIKIIIMPAIIQNHDDDDDDDQDNDLSLAQATELLRIVTVRSQQLKLPLVVAILDR